MYLPVRLIITTTSLLVIAASVSVQRRGSKRVESHVKLPSNEHNIGVKSRFFQDTQVFFWQKIIATDYMSVYRIYSNSRLGLVASLLPYSLNYLLVHLVSGPVCYHVMPVVTLWRYSVASLNCITTTFSITLILHVFVNNNKPLTWKVPFKGEVSKLSSWLHDAKNYFFSWVFKREG